MITVCALVGCRGRLLGIGGLNQPMMSNIMQRIDAAQTGLAALQLRLAVDVAVLKQVSTVAEQQGQAAIELLQQAVELAGSTNEATAARRGIDLLA